MNSTMLALIPGLSTTTAFVLLFTLAASSSVILIVILFRRVRRYGAYAYTNARVNAMKGSLKREDKLNPLIQTQSVQNFLSMLKDTAYATHLENVDPEPLQIEQAFHEQLADSYEKVASIAPEDVRKIYRKMEKIIEIENIKIILTNKFVNTPQEEIEEKLLPQRFLSEEVYNKAIKAQSFEKALAAFEETEYWEPINEIMSEVQETENLLLLWSKLEQKHWEEIRKTAQNSSAKGSEVVKEAIGMKIDIMNILTVLRCTNQNTGPDEIEKLLVPTYAKIDKEILTRAMEAEDVEEAAMALEDTYYGDIISEKITEYGNTNSVFVFEKALKEFFLTKLRTLSIQNYAETGPLTAFFYQKRAEINNLTTIVNGISEGLNSEEISEKLITPEVKTQ